VIEDSNDTTLKLAAVLSFAADMEFQCGTHPDALAVELEQAGLAAEEADRLAWGLGASLDGQAIDRVANRLRLLPELLALLINPAEGDVVAQTLTAVRGRLRDDCEICDTHMERIELYLHQGDGDEPLEQLLCDLVEHNRVVYAPTLDENHDADEDDEAGDWFDRIWADDEDDEELEEPLHAAVADAAAPYAAGGEFAPPTLDEKSRLLFLFEQAPPSLRSQLLADLETLAEADDIF
jgi:hypothetical protein